VATGVTLQKTKKEEEPISDQDDSSLASIFADDSDEEIAVLGKRPALDFTQEGQAYKRHQK
jgi:hypothetical protein